MTLKEIDVKIERNNMGKENPYQEHVRKFTSSQMTWSQVDKQKVLTNLNVEFEKMIEKNKKKHE